MIHVLHGAVGMPEDWEKVLPHAQAWNLWEMLSIDERSLAEAGEIIARGSADGDTLVGYSMGGRIALHAILSGQCRWKEAVIISAHPGLRDGKAERLKSDAAWAELATSDWPAFIREWNSQSVLSGPEPDWPDRAALESRQEEVSRSFRCWSLGAQEDLRPYLSRIECPVRWIVGEEDKNFLSLAREVVPLIPKATLEVIPATGHRVPWSVGFNLEDL